MSDKGQRMYELCDELFPICRSLTGNGVRKTLEILKREKELSNSAMYSMMGDATKDLFTGIFNSPEFKEEMNKRKNKLNANRTVNGHSAKERRRGKELELLEQAGQISDLRKQVRYLLIPAHYEVINGKRTCVERAAEYVADFVYQENGQLVVEDVKGYKKGCTYNLFVLKRKLMLQVYGIKIKET